MEGFNFNVTHLYVDISTFKESDINRLKSSILGKNDINELVNFIGYGIATFENHKHDRWNIECINKFTRGKINCLIFNVKEDEVYNPYKYTKLIVFQNLTKNIESYGFVWVKDNERSLIRFCLDYIDDEVVKRIMEDLNSWKLHHIYSAYSHKPKLNAVEMKKAYVKYIETYRCKSYKDWEASLKVYNQRYVL